MDEQNISDLSQVLNCSFFPDPEGIEDITVVDVTQFLRFLMKPPLKISRADAKAVCAYYLFEPERQMKEKFVDLDILNQDIDAREVAAQHK